MKVSLLYSISPCVSAASNKKMSFRNSPSGGKHYGSNDIENPPKSVGILLWKTLAFYNIALLVYSFCSLLRLESVHFSSFYKYNLNVASLNP